MFPVRFKGFVIEKKCGTDQNICFMLASFEILVFPLYTRYPKGEAVFLLYGRNKERTALQYPSLSYGIKKLLFHAEVKRVKRKLL